MSTIERSCGAVVFTRENGGIQYVIIASLEGFYGYPKGHMEGTETEEETALREIREEVGLNVRLLPGFRYVDQHPIPSKPGVVKQIVYFLAEFEGQPLRYQPSELRSAECMSFEEAMQVFQFESSREILRAANRFLV